MKRRSLLKISIQALASAWAWPIEAVLASGNGDWQVQVQPEPLETGTMGLVKVYPPQGVEKIRAYFDGKNIPVFPNHSMEKWPFGCFVPVALTMKPGRTIITFRARVNGESLLYSHPLMIKKKEYPKEFLKVKKKYAEFPPAILKRIRSDQAAVAHACRKITPEIYWQGPFVKPVPGRMTSPFGLRRYFNGQPRSPHSGADFAAPVGTPVKASNRGVVVMARDCYLSGKTLIVDHGYGLFTLYCHLSSFKAAVGDQVPKRAVIALSGKSGRITGPHLHWGVSLLGKRLDPQSLLNVSRHFA